VILIILSCIISNKQDYTFTYINPVYVHKALLTAINSKALLKFVTLVFQDFAEIMNNFMNNAELQHTSTCSLDRITLVNEITDKQITTCYSVNFPSPLAADHASCLVRFSSDFIVY